SEVNDKINIWFSNNLRNGASPSNTPEKSPEQTLEFNSPFSKYGNVVFHSNPIVQKSIDDGVAEPQEKTILSEQSGLASGGQKLTDFTQGENT
ncbi:MAG TPA: hypothetical protein VGM52_17415, partial [Herbaspirillum sp.]